MQASTSTDHFPPLHSTHAVVRHTCARRLLSWNLVHSRDVLNFVKCLFIIIVFEGFFHVCFLFVLFSISLRTCCLLLRRPLARSVDTFKLTCDSKGTLTSAQFPSTFLRKLFLLCTVHTHDLSTPFAYIMSSYTVKSYITHRTPYNDNNLIFKAPRQENYAATLWCFTLP